MDGEPLTRPGALRATDATSKGALTRRAILDAAIARFGRDGFRSSSVADVARDAGVGGSLVYAYFPNKEALFLAALDEDAAGVIDEGVTTVLDDRHGQDEWRETLVLTLLEALDRHALARRVLSGLEPHVTHRMLEIPAMAELRKAVAERLRSDQAAGLVRPELDAASIADGAVIIVLSLLMSVLQFGREGLAVYGRDVVAVLAAALDPPG